METTGINNMKLNIETTEFVKVNVQVTSQVGKEIVVDADDGGNGSTEKFPITPS